MTTECQGTAGTWRQPLTPVWSQFPPSHAAAAPGDICHLPSLATEERGGREAGEGGKEEKEVKFMAGCLYIPLSVSLLG